MLSRLSRYVWFGTITLITTIHGVEVHAVTYGDPVDAPQLVYPEVVPVWVGGRLCSGVLIEQQVVLTAAHCIYGRSGAIQVAVGGASLNSGRLIDVNATWYHPRYDASYLQNDLALLHLKESSGVARLANLPRSKSQTKPRKFTLAGWGRDQNGLLTGRLSVLGLRNEEVSAARAFRGEFNSRTMIGAGRFFQEELLYGGGCSGDSGGPLYQGSNGGNRTVIGITSWGAEGCVQYKPTVFTWVNYYLSDLAEAIPQLKNRAVQAPLPGGKATPVGVGPTTTTTTLPPAPLTVRFLTASTNSQGIDGRFETNLQSPNRVTKICFVVNDRPFPEYDGGDLYFDYHSRIQSGGPGCYENITNTGVVNWTLWRIREYQSSTVYATIFDTLGRSVVTPVLRAQGTNPRTGFSLYPITKTEYSTTTEINVMSSTGDLNVVVKRVCLSVTMNGSLYTAISSGRNGWTDVGGGCVENTLGADVYTTYKSSSMIQNPTGIQDWVVHAQVYTSDGSNRITSSYGYSS
jgi:V8-like Glu-specific endopeptidase